MIKLVIFDLDDTLIRTVEAIIAGRRAVLAYWKRDYPTFSRTQAFNTWKHLFWHFKNEFHPDLLHLLAREQHIRLDGVHFASIQDIYYQAYWPALKINDGAHEVLGYLTAKGIALGMCSNGDIELQQEKIVRTGLSQYFSFNTVFVVRPWSLKAKPGPRGLRTLMERLSAKPEETVYIGDRATDMIAANMARVIPVLYRSNFQSIDVEDCAKGSPFFVEQPKYTIKHLSDILSLSLKL